MSGNVGQPGPVECVQHPLCCGLATGQHRDVVIQLRYHGYLGAVSGQARPAGERDMAAARRRGGMRAHPGACGRGDAEHTVA